MAPKVSVILPVYNAGGYLREAIDSILHQTFTDFELVIVNDGSTDGSDSVIRSYTDSRIRYIVQENQGVRGALNTALAAASGEYIARMDQDDISDPRRFALQVEFLDQHTDHIVVGTTYAYINQHGQVTGVFPALLNDVDIRRELFTKSPFGHGSVMLRAAPMREQRIVYRADYTDDYDLWFQLAPHGKFANLPEVLYFWRNLSSGITSLHGKEQQTEARALQQKGLTEDAKKQLLRWPSWRAFRLYHNESVVLQGSYWVIARRFAFCSMYLNLMALFSRNKIFGAALRCALYAIVSSPRYVLHVTTRRLQHRS